MITLLACLLARSVIDLVCSCPCGPNMFLSRVSTVVVSLSYKHVASYQTSFICLFSSIFVDFSSLCIKEWPQRIFCAVISFEGLAEQDTENHLGRVHLPKIPTSSQPQLSAPSPIEPTSAHQQAACPLPVNRGTKTANLCHQTAIRAQTRPHFQNQTRTMASRIPYPLNLQLTHEHGETNCVNPGQFDGDCESALHSSHCEECRLLLATRLRVRHN